MKQPEGHPNILTFIGVPLSYGDITIGQLGLFNNPDGYQMEIVEQIIPVKNFFSNFIYLWKQQRLNVTKELELKKQVVTLKDSFIATMSHEIRTPLNGIVGMARLLSDSDNLSDKQSRYIRILAECSTQLMELVNDILDYSKMSAGSIILNKQPFNLRSCIQKAVDIISHRATDKGLDIKIDIPMVIPENVTGDSRRLNQVLFNLLTNAIKFTDTGFVKLAVTFEDIPSDEYTKSKKIIFTVQDTGIGISKIDQNCIFEVFTKISKDDRFYTNTTPGAGMGLAISKYIIESMNGAISVDSDGKTGSIFTFYIILEDETDIIHLMELHGKDLRDKIAIIVDDTEDNRIFLMDTFYSWGIKALSFSSAREALNYMEKDTRFDIAIVDLCMPNMSGIELTQTMRERGYKQPVIGLSSIGINVPGHEWFDHFTTKPISKSRLFNLVLRCFVMQETKTVLPKRDIVVERETRELRILIAEDDYYNQILITELLNTLGYTNIKVVSNGKLCVDEAKANKYDICLMDVKMPVMDGLDATRRIKKMSNPPTIIAVSASVLDADKNRCYAAGMDGYIAKPIKLEQLESVLKSLELRLVIHT
uniref:Histidine kinase n=1 Tax=Marseillevirus LCMAC201 TaxID=2506605 RepID=A0A481YVC7_9VIRU|nr:MAG: uncharacterized protein LCMAC201_01450 [Marseillevirus LCMAC201]